MRKADEDSSSYPNHKSYKSKELIEEKKKPASVGRASTKRKKGIKDCNTATASSSNTGGLMSELQIKIMVTKTDEFDDISCHTYDSSCEDDIENVTSEMLRLTEEEERKTKYDAKL